MKISPLMPLLQVSASGDVDDVRALLAAGAAVNRPNRYGETALILAVRTGRTAVVRLLLAAGADVSRTCRRSPNGGYSALACAAVSGQLELVWLLLDAGADVEQRGPYGCTAVVLARRHLETVQLLCAHMSVRESTLCEEMPADTRRDCLEWLKATRRWTRPLHHWPFLTASRVRALLVAGADVCASDGGADAPTPLSLARARLRVNPTDERARLIACAAAAWSPETHALFPLREQARAAELLRVCSELQRLARHLVPARDEVALRDVWIAHVLPAVVGLSDSAALLTC